MFIKKKNISVVVFSSLIIIGVFVVTLAGYHIYIQWKQDTLASRYRDSIYELTAQLFKDDVLLTNVGFISGDESTRPFAAPAVQGNIKNNSGKMITSIAVEIAFVDPKGIVTYKEKAYPLEARTLDHSINPSVRTGPQKILLPGENMTFRVELKNCPREIMKKISEKDRFAKDVPGEKLTLFFSIAGMTVS